MKLAFKSMLAQRSLAFADRQTAHGWHSKAAGEVPADEAIAQLSPPGLGRPAPAPGPGEGACQGSDGEASGTFGGSLDLTAAVELWRFLESSGILAECSGGPGELGAMGWTRQAGPLEQ